VAGAPADRADDERQRVAAKGIQRPLGIVVGGDQSPAAERSNFKAIS
jgi:hypothetical protein